MTSNIRNDDSAAQLAAIIRSSHDAIIGQDLDGSIVSWNPGAERLYGYRAVEVMGKNSSILATKDNRAAEVALLAGIAAGQQVESLRTKRMHKSGAVLDVSLSVSPIIDDADAIVGMATSSRDISELLLAQSRFQGLLEAAPDAMISVDERGTINLVNDQVERLFGWTRAELLGQPVEILVPKAARVGHPALRDSYFRHPTNRPMGVVEAQLSAQRKDGSTFAADISLGYLKMGQLSLVTAAVRDVTDRIVVQNALRESESNFRQLAESTDVAFVLRNLDPPAFIYASSGFAKIYGYDPIQLRETPQETISRIHPDDIAAVKAVYWRAAERGLAANAEWRIIRPDGETRWVRATTTPVVDADGVVRRSAGTVEDITDRRLDEINLRHAHAEAQKANAAKDEFLSRMSHELRTPLNAVLGFAQLLELDPLSLEQKEAVQYILRGGRHLLSLIDDVLDITKIESDQLSVSIEPILASELLAETIKMMSPLSKGMEVTVHCAPDPAQPLYVRADRRRLRQVLLNLLSNAIKYNVRGGRVDISCCAGDDGFVDISFADTGRGIDSADLHRLFVPFDRLGANDTDIEGTGVGLALSQRLMANMNGSLLVKSERGVGSTFSLSIPIADPMPEPAMPAADSQIVATADRRPINSMVYVEDNAPNIEFMESLLTRRPSWQMIVARDGAIGLKIIVETLPHLVLLDLHLPEIDGVEVLRRIRSDPRCAGLKVVVLSADASPRQMDRLLAAGADHYVTKPLDVSRFLALLDANVVDRLTGER